MFVKVLGAIDFIGGLLLIFGEGAKFPDFLFIILAMVLIVKSSLGLWKSFASWIDLVSGIIFIMMVFFNIHWIICIACGIFLIQKGIFSFL